MAASIPAPGSPPANGQPITSSTSPMSFEQQVNAEKQQRVWDALLRTPIAFYGQVVDIHGEPLAGAAVSISIADTPWDHHTRLRKTTDAQGRFDVAGHGLGLVVQTSKIGYYTIAESSGSFNYVPAAGKLSVYNEAKSPAKFILQKTGDSERLIVTRDVLKVAKDGTGKAVSLTTGKASSAGKQDLVVQALVRDQGVADYSNEPYDWQCTLTVPGGGIQPRQAGGFDFTAPTGGYSSSAEISMPAGTARWSRSASRSYFILLANGEYARMDFVIGVGTPSQFEVTAFLNPTPGHTNLEYDADHTPPRPDWGALTGR